MTQPIPNCVHHWLLGKHDVGICVKCGEVQDFAMLRESNRLRHVPHQVASAEHPKSATSNKGSTC